MDRLIVITTCTDGSCCCLPPRATIALISILSMVTCLVDFLSYDSCGCCSPMKDYVKSLRLVLAFFFQMANLLLLSASIFENSFLVSVYLWYTLGFIIMGLCVALADLLLRIMHEGASGLIEFFSEVSFLFVISRCLPLVDTYRKKLVTNAL